MNSNSTGRTYMPGIKASIEIRDREVFITLDATASCHFCTKETYNIYLKSYFAGLEDYEGLVPVCSTCYTMHTLFGELSR